MGAAGKVGGAGVRGAVVALGTIKALGKEAIVNNVKLTGRG